MVPLIRQVMLCPRMYSTFVDDHGLRGFCGRFIVPLQRLHTARRELRRKRAKQIAGIDIQKNKLNENDGIYKWKVVMIGRKAVDLMQRLLVYLIGEIVNGMMGYIPLSVIMDKLLSDNGKHEFGDFKGTILQMLGLYGYEQMILVVVLLSIVHS